jgi:hypothetical protein
MIFFPPCLQIVLFAYDSAISAPSRESGLSRARARAYLKVTQVTCALRWTRAAFSRSSADESVAFVSPAKRDDSVTHAYSSFHS